MRVELVGKWRALLCRRRRGDVPWTNNATERAIGRSKIRVQDYQGVQERRWDAERVWADAAGMERPGRTGYVGDGRGATPRRRLGEPRPPKPAPKCPTVSGTDFAQPSQARNGTLRFRAGYFVGIRACPRRANGGVDCREWVERGADAGRGYKIRRAAKGARQPGACNSSRLSPGE